MLKKLISGITPGIGRTIEGPRFTITFTGVKLMIETIVTTIQRWRGGKPVRSILLIISLCVVYLRTICW